MSLITVNNAQLEIIKGFVKSFNKNDTSSKEVFCTILALYKANPEHHNAVILELGKIINQVSQGNNGIIKRFKDISKLAKYSFENKVLLKMSIAYFYNIEASIKLFRALQEVGNEEGIKECRELLFNCYNKELSMVAYNNIVRDTIKNLRLKYKIIEIEGADVVTDLTAKALKLSKEDRATLMEALKASLV